jgi:hypothetical protein
LGWGGLDDVREGEYSHLLTRSHSFIAVLR